MLILHTIWFVKVYKDLNIISGKHGGAQSLAFGRQVANIIITAKLVIAVYTKLLLYCCL